VDALCEALRLLDELRFAPAALRAAAEPFAPEAFDRAFRAAFARGYEEWRAASEAEVPAIAAR
jgi:DNA-binding IclR family transcriptional regulator